MKTSLLVLILFFIPFCGTTQWINEIHYDNYGTDSGEGIEVAGLAGTDLSCWTLVPYNGNGGAVYSSTGLSGTIPDEGCGYGAIWFPIVGLQNGAPDGIALVDCGGNVVMFLSYDGSFTATDGPASGMTSTDIGVTEPGDVGYSLQLAGSGTVYGDFTWQAPAASSTNSLNTGQSISSCGPITNTITINSLSSLSYGVDCTTGDAGIVNITTTDVFTAGNTYTVELSDASGVFASPTVIGSLPSTFTGTMDINFTIPAGTAAGGGYRIRVVSSNPSVTSADNGSDIVITLTGSPCVLEPPHLTSVIINSCNTYPTCEEGQNEMVFGTSGDYSIDVTAANFNFSYTNYPPLDSGDNFTDVLTNNSTATDTLNAQCASTDPFIDAAGTTIPPNSSWVLLNNAICVTDALDWSGLCNSGPIYVIYSSDPTWLIGGTFSNGTDTIRPYQTSITTTNGQTFTIDYETDGSQYANSDGVFASFDADGGSATSYGDDNCMLQPVVLPIELYSFDGEIINNESHLQWTTLSEYNFSHFEIFHATDMTSFYKIGTVNAAGNTNMTQDYRMIHPHPVPGVNYYRLAAVDNDGTSRNHGIIALNLDIHFAYYNGNAIILNSPYAVEIYNLQGQLIIDSSEEVTIPFNHKGVFFIREVNSGTTQKIVIQ